MMKIKLERTLANCPTHLRCTICSRPFEVGKIRKLLCDSNGLIQGDLCSTCSKLSSKHLKQKLQTNEEIIQPKFYQWWFKRLTILSEATQEIEQARLGSSRCHCQNSRGLKILFQRDDDS